MARRFTFLAFVIAALGAAATAAWGAGHGSAKGPIVITCTGCQDSATDIFIHEAHLMTEAFNAKYKGKYEIKDVPFAGINDVAQMVPYFKRLALANKLPDLFWGGGFVIADLAKSGRIVDWAPSLKKDPAWAKGFYPNAFLSLKDSKGHIWGIPSFRDALGIFWNKELFAKAGLTTFPKTWGELLAACQKLQAAGVTPIALDGQWVTLLWWAHLIGTQPGGAAFLNGAIAKGNFNKWPQVVRATQRLKELQAFANKDSFSGDFFAADTQFVTGKAAMLANGPWEIPAGIKGKNAIPGLYDKLGYAVAPGGGLVVVAGTGSWASGAKDEARRQAVLAFMKFMTSKQVQIRKYKNVGGAWARKFPITDAELRKVLDPLYYPVFKASETIKYTYPYPQFTTPAGFVTAWTNNWPAHVQGDISTTEFLNRMSAAATGR
jgi:raffinose/stachyose/melibiose transport system substrate-binding protein